MPSANKKYNFVNFQIDATEERLLRDGEPVPLEDKAFQLLFLLVKNAGRIVEKEEIFSIVWAETSVEENNLTVALSKIRKALKDDAKQPSFIETVPRKGLRFVAKVVEESDESTDLLDQPPPTSTQRQKIPVIIASVYDFSDNHTIYVVAGSIAYGALFAVALLLEISYEFNRYGNQALWLSLPTVGFTSAATIASLTYTEQLTRRNKPQGFFLGVIFFTCICFSAWLILNPFLPDFAITRTDGIQPQTASTAFFKNTMIYFWSLGVIFLFIPFYLVTKLQDKIRRQENYAFWRILIFLYEIAIFIFWMIALVFALRATFFLFDRLSNRGFRIYFETLAWIRFWIWFILSLTCQIWFVSYAARLIENTRIEIIPSLKNTEKILRIRLIFSLAIFLLSLILIWIINSDRQIPPKVSRLEATTPITAEQEFFVNFYGEDFESDVVCIRVVGNGCPELQPCEVPNSALKKHSVVTKNRIENVPITLSKGEFYLFAQNGDSSLSNPISLIVP